MKFENDKGEPVEVNFHNFERIIPDGKAGRLHPREVHRQVWARSSTRAVGQLGNGHDQ